MITRPGSVITDVIPLKQMAIPENPYSSPDAESNGGRSEHANQSKWKRMLLGFLIGGSIPFVVGIYLVLRSDVDAGFNGSGGYTSGVIPVRALLLIFIASPLLGIIGAIASRFVR